MSEHLPRHGVTYILIEKRTVPDALSVLPLLTYVMASQDPFIIVEYTVQRKSSKNSNAYY
jgi:hypothetical protein